MSNETTTELLTAVCAKTNNLSISSSDNNKVPCVLCKHSEAEVVEKEFQCFSQSVSLLCKNCYHLMHSFLTSKEVSSHQEQRNRCLLRKTHYFGVLDLATASDVWSTSNIFDNGGHFFLWEVQIPNPASLYQTVPIVAVSYTRADWYHFNARLKYTPSADNQLDKHTVYIVRGDDAEYYTAFGSYWFTDEKDFDTLCRDGVLKHAAPTLKEAIREACAYHRLFMHTHFPDFRCQCRPLSKYIDPAPRATEHQVGPRLNNPWSLQQLSAFSVRNSCYSFQQDLFALLPHRLRELVAKSPQLVREHCAKPFAPRF